jgi:hypothetical protein
MSPKEQVEKILGRPVAVEQTKTGKWICQYVDFSMRPLSLVADTEELAYENLLTYLLSKAQEP